VLENCAQRNDSFVLHLRKGEGRANETAIIITNKHLNVVITSYCCSDFCRSSLNS